MYYLYYYHTLIYIILLHTVRACSTYYLHRGIDHSGDNDDHRLTGLVGTPTAKETIEVNIYYYRY